MYDNGVRAYPFRCTCGDGIFVNTSYVSGSYKFSVHHRKESVDYLSFDPLADDVLILMGSVMTSPYCGFVRE